MDYIKSREEDSDTRSLIAGATPLLVGLLSGNTGDAAEIAGKALVQEDRRKLQEDQSLMDYLKKKRIAEMEKSDSGSQLGKLQSKRLGSGKYAVFSPVTGKYYDPDTLSEIRSPEFYRETPELVGKKEEARKKIARKYGSGKSWGTDEEGRIGVRDVVTEEFRPIARKENLTPKQRARLTKALDKFDTITKNQRDGIDAAEKFKEAIRIGNPISDQYAIFKLAAAADNGGRLSDQDVERFGGSKALAARIAQAKQTLKDGRLTEENRKFMLEIADAMIKTNKKQLERKARTFSKRRSDVVGVDLYQYLKPGDKAPGDKAPGDESIRVSNGRETYDIDPKDLEDAKKDGFEVVK